jgi:HD-GYP domain-containing protein (c-di-GMP phosphodiesterase class II)
VLIKVAHHELQNRLSFNVYESNGSLLFVSGTRLSEKDLNQLQRLSLYRKAEQLPVNHEGQLFHLPTLTPEDHAQSQLEEAVPSIFGDELNARFIAAIEGFWRKMQHGQTPDIALCELIRDKLVSELTTEVDQLLYLSQLRVRDCYTYSHTLHVCALSVALAMKVGKSAKEVREIGLASILHDLGKLLIPKQIMFKTSRLSEKEFDVMKLHPELGYKIIVEELRLPEEIARPALEHQEMYGGGGYPQNLVGDDIHPYSQIVKVADVYDALTSRRPYKDTIPSARAVGVMLSEGAKSFNPELLAAFLDLANADQNRLQGP